MIDAESLKKTLKWSLKMKFPKKLKNSETIGGEAY